MFGYTDEPGHPSPREATRCSAAASAAASERRALRRTDRPPSGPSPDYLSVRNDRRQACRPRREGRRFRRGDRPDPLRHLGQRLRHAYHGLSLRATHVDRWHISRPSSTWPGPPRASVRVHEPDGRPTWTKPVARAAQDRDGPAERDFRRGWPAATTWSAISLGERRSRRMRFRCHLRSSASRAAQQFRPADIESDRVPSHGC